MPPADLETSDGLPWDYHVAAASLSDEAQQQIHDTVLDEGGAAHADLDAALSAARDADSHRDAVEALHKEQAEAVDHGDYAKANDLAHQTEYEIKAVEADGGAGDKELAQTYRDELNTSQAVAHHEMAADQAGSAQADASMGHDVAASDAAEHAADHAHEADSLAGHADQGGSTADHSYTGSDHVEETSE